MEETVNAKNGSALTVVLNVGQQFDTLSNTYKDEDLKGEYCILAKDNSYPLPENMKGGKFNFELQGKNHNRKLEFVFEQEGLYEYTIEQISLERQNYSFDKKVYNIFIDVERLGEKLVAQVIVKNNLNEKVTNLIFNNSYNNEKAVFSKADKLPKTGIATNTKLFGIIFLGFGGILFIVNYAHTKRRGL
ncbi:Spy0128 family protein [Granulicatella balaenopterae]|nr:FctA domain-containing protein [Granulicatella balaenopterae]